MAKSKVSVVDNYEYEFLDAYCESCTARLVKGYVSTRSGMTVCGLCETQLSHAAGEFDCDEPECERCAS